MSSLTNVNMYIDIKRYVVVHKEPVGLRDLPSA